MGKGHATRDTIEWMLPILWPLDLMNLPRRGPRPSLKEETRVTLKVMDDLRVPETEQPQRNPSGLIRRAPAAYTPPPQQEQPRPAPTVVSVADEQPDDEPPPPPQPMYVYVPVMMPPPPVYGYVAWQPVALPPPYYGYVAWQPVMLPPPVVYGYPGRRVAAPPAAYYGNTAYNTRGPVSAAPRPVVANMGPPRTTLVERNNVVYRVTVH
jgi:hypothetical protein